MALGRKTGGRAKGTPNKRKASEARAMAEASARIGAMIPNAFSGGAHELLMAVYKDPSFPVETRLDAAAKAIRFEAPPIGSIEPNRGDKPQPPSDAPRTAPRSDVGEIVSRFQAASLPAPNGNGALKH